MCEVQVEVPGIQGTVNLQVDTGATVSAIGLSLANVSSKAAPSTEYIHIYSTSDIICCRYLAPCQRM